MDHLHYWTFPALILSLVVSASQAQIQSQYVGYGWQEQFRCCDNDFLIRIELPHDRTQYGRLEVEHLGRVILGPFPVIGKSGNAISKKNGNPNRDPLLPFGDTPSGVYAAWTRDTSVTNSNGIRYDSVRTRSGKLSYGRQGLVVLDPIAGEAASAEGNGRSGLLIHAGDLSDDGALRPTAGCIRLFPRDMMLLTEALLAAQSPVPLDISARATVVIEPEIPLRPITEDSEIEVNDPPPAPRGAGWWEDDYHPVVKNYAEELHQDFVDEATKVYTGADRLERLHGQGSDQERVAVTFGGSGAQFSSMPKRQRGSGSGRGGTGSGPLGSGVGGNSDDSCAADFCIVFEEGDIFY